MSIESDLKKDGITVIEPLDITTVNVIAKNVSKKIVAAFLILALILILFMKDSLNCLCT